MRYKYKLFQAPSECVRRINPGEYGWVSDKVELWFDQQSNIGWEYVEGLNLGIIHGEGGTRILFRIPYSLLVIADDSLEKDKIK